MLCLYVCVVLQTAYRHSSWNKTMWYWELLAAPLWWWLCEMFARFAGAIFKVCSSLSRYCNFESAAAVMPVDEMRLCANALFPWKLSQRRTLLFKSCSQLWKLAACCTAPSVCNHIYKMWQREGSRFKFNTFVNLLARLVHKLRPLYVANKH